MARRVRAFLDHGQAGSPDRYIPGCRDQPRYPHPQISPSWERVSLAQGSQEIGLVDHFIHRPLYTPELPRRDRLVGGFGKPLRRARN